MIGRAAHQAVDRHFAGDAGGARSGARLFRHLARCERCRRRYDSYARLEALAPDSDSAARERLAAAIFPAPSRRGVLAAGLGLAVALGAVTLWWHAPPASDTFRARGPEAPVAAAPALAIFRIRPGGGTERAGSIVQSGDALAFSYVNPPETGYSRLMVFAIDGAGRVFWFWPAWESAGANPESVPITAAGEAVELGESVRHPLGSGPLVVVGLFSQRAHRVSDVETAVARAGLSGLTGLTGLTGNDGRLWTETLEVAP